MITPILFFLFSFFASAQPVDSCLQSLTDYFPRTWRIDQKQVEQYLIRHPDQAALFQKYSWFASFIEAKENQSLFDWLGTQYYLSAADRIQTDSKQTTEKYVAAAAEQLKLNSDEIEKMKLVTHSQINFDVDAMEAQGLHGVRFFFEGAGVEVLKAYDLGPENFKLQTRVPKSSLRVYLTVQQLLYSRDPSVHAAMEKLTENFDLFFSLLGPADFEEAKPFPILSTDYDPKKVKQIEVFLKSRGYILPSFVDYTIHSSAARNYVVNLILRSFKQNLSREELDEFLLIYKKSVLGEAPPVPPKYQEINRLLIAEYTHAGTLIRQLMPTVTSPKKVKELYQDYLIDMINFIHSVRINSLVRVENATVSSSILFYLIALSNFADLTQDRGLEPLIYKSFVHLVLKKPLLSADDYRAMLRRGLKEKISAILKQDVEPKKDLLVASVQPLELPKLMVNEKRQAPPAKKNKPAETQEIEIPVGIVPEKIEPNIPIQIVIKPFGFVYRASFSEAVVSELSTPWREALARGPARDQSRDGWKQVRDYEWQITLPNSHQRLVGYRDPSGLWYFTHFVFDH